MIDRLLVVLRFFAAPPDVQLRDYPQLLARGHDLAGDFADALLLVSDCPQLHLTQTEVRVLHELDGLLEQLSAAEHNAHWTESALGQAPWTTARQVATRALSLLGAANEIDFSIPSTACRLIT